MEFAALLDKSSPELRDTIIAQAREEDPDFLQIVLHQFEESEQAERSRPLQLERFKRSSEGLVEFAKVLEQATPKVREAILDKARQQDEKFVENALRKTVFFEELVYLDEGVLAEILGETPAKVLAYALHKMPRDFRDTIIKFIGHRGIRTLKDEEEKLGDKPAMGLVLGARRQILRIARSQEGKDKFVFELVDCPRFKSRQSA